MAVQLPRALLDGLFVAATERTPRAAEADAIARELGSTLAEVPPVLVAALEALLTQQARRAPMSAEEASWSWVLQVVAQIVPGAALVWAGSSVNLSVPSLPMSLTVEGGDPASYRIGLSFVPRLTADAGGHLVLLITPELEPLLAACEALCVADCCGTNAFTIASDRMRTWITSSGYEAALAASRELDAILEELATAREAQVVSRRFNAAWSSPAECADYLRQWRARLGEALARAR